MRAITGAGSLPHTDPAAAARLAGSAVVPYLAQLPLRHPAEGMLRQWGDGLCGCGGPGEGLGLSFGAPPGPRDEAFVGAAAVLDALHPATPLVKTQATGPVTLAAAMRAAGHPGGGLWSCVVEGLVVRIAEHLEAVRARLPAAEVVLVLDEPALSALDWDDPGSGAAGDALREVVSSVAGPVGIHCCGDADWGPPAALAPAFLFLDVASLGPRFVASAPDVARAVSASTRIIWGAVPADHPPLPSVDTLVARLRRAEGVLVLAGADFRALDTAWLSSACGLAGVTVESAERVVARLGEVAEVLG